MRHGTIMITNRKRIMLYLLAVLGCIKCSGSVRLIPAIITKGLCPGPDSRYWSIRTYSPAEKVQELSG